MHVPQVLLLTSATSALKETTTTHHPFLQVSTPTAKMEEKPPENSESFNILTIVPLLSTITVVMVTLICIIVSFYLTSIIIATTNPIQRIITTIKHLIVPVFVNDSNLLIATFDVLFLFYATTLLIIPVTISTAATPDQTTITQVESTRIRVFANVFDLLIAITFAVALLILFPIILFGFEPKLMHSTQISNVKSNTVMLIRFLMLICATESLIVF